jgi:hypothetical protein
MGMLVQTCLLIWKGTGLPSNPGVDEKNTIFNLFIQESITIRIEMLRFFLLVLLLSMSWWLHGQNSIQVFGGYQNTQNTVAEYAHPTNSFYRIDSVDLTTRTGSPFMGLSADIEIGKNLFLNAGMSFSTKGIKYITYTTFSGTYFESWVGTQEYFSVHLLFKYYRKIGTGPFGVYIGTGTRIDFPYGEPTNAALANGPGASYIAPFGRFSRTELTWMSHAGGSFDLGPGHVLAEFHFLAGITNPIEDHYIYDRTRSFGVVMGYAFHLPSK